MAFLTQEKITEVGANTGPDKRYFSLTKMQEDKPYRIRFVGEGITGYEAWTTASKPVRWDTLPDELPANIRPDDSGKVSAKYFICGIVWDYAEDMFRVLSISQKTILESLHKYMQDEDYGPDMGYDLVLSRKGTGKETKYNLLAKIPKPLSSKIKAEFAELDWDLTRLYSGDSPWPDTATAPADSASPEDEETEDDE